MTCATQALVPRLRLVMPRLADPCRHGPEGPNLPHVRGLIPPE